MSRVCAALAALTLLTPLARGDTMKAVVEPLSRYFLISYQVPAQAPPSVLVRCTWSPAGGEDWRPAKVTPLLSATALRLLPEEPAGSWQQWAVAGEITERRAAGLTRTVVFNPYPEAQAGGKVDVRFRVELSTPEGASLAASEAHLQADNSDVVYLEDFSRVLQQGSLATGSEPVEGKWTYRTGRPSAEHLSGGDELYARPTGQTPLPDLTYPLNLRGTYALYVCTRARYGVRLRLSGDERCDGVDSRHPTQELLWRVARLDRQHLVIGQTEGYDGYGTAQLDYLKLVPLTPAQVAGLEPELAPQGGKPDKLVAGYFEPYSWAFGERVTRNVQHREPLTAFAAGGVQLLDCQMGRFGASANYETRVASQLLAGTFGDPIGTVARPTTDNVGLLQQYTNTCETELRYARELGLTFHANFGATNCYVGTPLEGAISKEHPQWRRGHALRYEVPEVVDHLLAMYREVLEIGAPGLSIDFCRYPEGIDRAETCTAFLRRLRALATEVGEQRRQPVPILIRFPATGVRLAEHFDYRAWLREKLVDYLCPSNIQGRHLHFDLAPYAAATRGTSCKLLPVVDGLSWGLQFPGPFLWRVQQLYDAGADGIYVYQADARLLGRPEDRRVMRLLGSSAAVRRYWERESAANASYTKGIYLTPYHQEPGYHGWERLRLWTEGIEQGAVEVLLDGKLVQTCPGPPYLLGSEDYSSDGVIPGGRHTLLVRAKDGDGWLEQGFEIVGG